MKKFVVDIAPGYGHPHTGSLTDGKHGCTVAAENMKSAVEKVRARAANERWPRGHARITEINTLGQRIEGKFFTAAQIIPIN